jgi:hypothetical protein
MLHEVINFTSGEQKHVHTIFNDLIRLFIDLRKWLQHWEENAQGKVLFRNQN